MKDNFEIVFPLLIDSEGKRYSNTPGDRGGPTKYGITIDDVQRYVKKDATSQDVRNLTLDQAKAIYLSKYWGALDCDSLSSGVDYTCFDYGVNSGLGRPRKALQQFKSLTGTQLIDAINNERTAFLKALGAHPTQTKFLKGWLARVDRVRSFSKQLAQKNTTAGPAATTTTVIAATGFATYFHDHMAYILAGGFGAAILIGLIIHYAINKGK